LVRLLLRHLLIPSLETGSLTTLLPHDVFSVLFLSSFGALYSGQTFCVYMGCTDIDYCIYDICGLWMVLVFFYGYVFMAMCMDVFMDMYLWLCIYGYVFVVMCMGIGSRSSVRPGSTDIGAYLSLGPVLTIFGACSFTRPISTILGTYSSTRPISANFGTYSSTRPISAIFGTYSSTRLISANFGTYSSTRPISAIFFWDLLLYEAHFSKFLGLTPPRGPFQQFLGLTPPRGPFQQIPGTYSFMRPIWMTLQFFQFFSDKNGKICPSV
jgi:hypothetical protein